MFDKFVKLSGITMQNPFMPVSGTFGYYGEDYEKFIDVGRLGAIITKTITLNPIDGNEQIGMYETRCGIIDSGGFQNVGVDRFIDDKLFHLLATKGPAKIVNISGNTADEFVEIVEKLSRFDIDAIELNLSCPNVHYYGQTLCQEDILLYNVIQSVKSSTNKPIITKLSSIVTDIDSIAYTAYKAGSDVLSLIDTTVPMTFDVDTKRPISDNVVSGMSGSCLKSIALRLLWQLSSLTEGGNRNANYNLLRDIPKIGMGGISKWQDVIEFFIAGAKAVAIDIKNLIDPCCIINIMDMIQKYGVDNGFTQYDELINDLNSNGHIGFVIEGRKGLI